MKILIYLLARYGIRINNPMKGPRGRLREPEAPECERRFDAKKKHPQFRMTKEEYRQLWLDCGADKMKNPHLHRDPPGGYYEIGKCKFVEETVHWELHYKSNQWKLKPRLEIAKVGNEILSTPKTTIPDTSKVGPPPISQGKNGVKVGNESQ